jgi:polyisoprenoid-binding protein YceI
MALYQFDPPHSRFTVQAFATGLLSAFAHSPTFTVGDYRGFLRFDPGQVADLSLELTIRADSIRLVDRVRESDRREIEGRMRSEVLDPSAYPEIAFRAGHAEAEPLGPGQYRLRLGGELSLRGLTRPHRLEAELLIFKDGLRLRGEDSLRMSEFGIKPVTAVAGSIRLKDEVRLSFDLGGLSEMQGTCSDWNPGSTSPGCPRRPATGPGDPPWNGGASLGGRPRAC